MNKDEIIGLQWWARDKVRGFMTGLHKSPDFGFSLDFAQHRAYVPGDSPKFIDWTVLARQDKYLTKQYEAESNLRAYFLLDSSASMHGSAGEKWDYAVRQIALSAALLCKQRDAIGLLDVREAEERFFEAKNTEDAMDQLLSFIASRTSPTAGNGDLESGIGRLLSEIPPRSEVLILTDPFHEDMESLCGRIGALVDAGHFIKLLLLVSKSKELTPDHYAGSFVVDSETGEKTLISLEEAKSLNLFIERQMEVVKSNSAMYGYSYQVLFTEDAPLLSFRKIIAPKQA
jgi:uncharacterized protein (DUF58 family)